MKMENKDYKKFYEEALERAKVVNKGTEDYNIVTTIFPELAESEDERIRKEIIQFLQLPHPQFVGKRNHEEWIAWLEKQGSPTKLSEEERNRFAKGVLSECAMSFINYLDSNKRKGKMCVSNMECEDIENAFHNAMWDRLHGYHCKYIDKQGEQKSEDNVKPKFKVGDWVISDKRAIAHIVKLEKDSYGTLRYYLEWTNGNKTDPMPCFVDDNFHLWTIQDAKDGDVLITHLDPEADWIGIYKESCGCDFYTHCFFNSVGEFISNPNRCKKHVTDCVHPATKEQCNSLFQKMKEAGYEWDAETKELKKVESDSSCNEDDDEVFKAIYEDLHSYYGSLANANMFSYKKELYEKKWENAKKWLEEHKKYKFTWNEEDKKIFKEIYEGLDAFYEFRANNGIFKSNKEIFKEIWERDKKLLESIECLMS